MTRRSPEGARGGAPASRDPRLDVFRGLALVMIFINHVPGSVFEEFTSRNFGFSDAAEAFVFMSGMAAGLAYSRPFREHGWLAASLRIWARARQLYFVHLAITVMAIAIMAAGALWLGKTTILGHNNMAMLFDRPLSALVGLPLLTFQIGYLNILPLYILLLALAPVMLVLAWRWPLALIAGSVALWALAGATGLTPRTFPGGGGWFFNPLAWQILFVIGLACGVRMRQGRALVPYHALGFSAALGFVIVVVFWMQVPEIGATGRGALAILSQWGAPDFVVWFNKNTLALPRLLHALALFYVVSSIPAVLVWCGGRSAAPLRLLGRYALPVFAAGTVLAIALQTVRWELDPDPVRDGLLLAAGLGVQLALAYGLDRARGRQLPAEPTAARSTLVSGPARTAPAE